MSKKSIIVILIILPFVLMLGAIPFANRIHPILFGLPFLHFWLFLSMIITPLCTYFIYKIQKSEGSID